MKQAPLGRRPAAGVPGALFVELLSGRWVARSRHEENGEILLVFSSKGSRVARLSTRHRQALELAARGRSIKQIAHEMRTGVSTASTHLAAGLGRLGLTRADVALLMATCIRSSAAHESPPEVEAVLSIRLDVESIPLSSELTTAERDVARALLRGHSNAKIAADRRRSLRTVANQVAVVFRKLGVRSRGELFASCAHREREE